MKKIIFVCEQDLGKGYQIRLEYEDITDEKYLEKARNELRESPENIENGIKIFKELVKGEQRGTIRVISMNFSVVSMHDA